MQRDAGCSAIVAASAAAALLLCAPGVGSAQTLRFATQQPGGIVAAGNALGLSKAPGVNGPGTAGSIGTFMSPDGANVDDDPPNTSQPWGPGTTNDWTQNGSSSRLVLPGDDSEVVYAELVWSGSYRYGGENLTAFLDMPVALAFGDDVVAASPDPSTAETLDYVPTSLGTDAAFYVRSSEVTEFVRAHGAGFYTVSSVPGTQATSNDAQNAAGWALVVVYRRDGEPIRSSSIVLGCGGVVVDVDATVDYSAYFCAPTSGTFGGRVAVAALEGDADEKGDRLSIAGVGRASYVDLSGPNNPADGFFASQIEHPTGALDQEGSFGANNHDALKGINIEGARQGWDLASVALSSEAGQLSADQRSAVVRASTTQDVFMPVFAAISVEVNAPRFSHVSSDVTVSPTFPPVGGFVTVTAALANEGGTAAADVRFTLVPPQGATLISFRLDGIEGDAHGAPVSVEDVANGVDAGALEVGATRTVEMQLALDVATTGSNTVRPVWTYSYVSCSDQGAIPEAFHARGATFDVTDEPAGTGGGGTAPAAGGPVTPTRRADALFARGGGACSTTAPGTDALGRWSALLIAVAALAARGRPRPQRARRGRSVTRACRPRRGAS